MVASIFPRHIIEFMSIAALQAVPEHMGCLARTHRDVTIMFMDIVGEALRLNLFMDIVDETLRLMLPYSYHETNSVHKFIVH